LLIISETTQAALVDEDNSFTNSMLLILSMLGLDVVFSCIKQNFPAVEKVMDGAPLIILNRGELMRDAMEKERVDEQDILHAARELHGIGTLKEVDYAILEQTGEITIIPKQASYAS
jgi:uncharacterized membrane protein YcaP (DUF421 family)